MWIVRIEYDNKIYRIYRFMNKLELNEWMTFHISQYVNDKTLTIIIRKEVM